MRTKKLRPLSIETVSMWCAIATTTVVLVAALVGQLYLCGMALETYRRVSLWDGPVSEALKETRE